MFEAVSSGTYGNKAMFTFLQANRTEGEDVDNANHALAAYQSEQASLAGQKARDEFKQSMLFFLLLYVFFALPATLFMVAALRRLNKGLTDVEAAVNATSEGDLTHAIRLSGNDEMTHIKRQVQTMQTNLTHLIQSIRDNVTTVENRVSDLTESSARLVDQNVRQSASLEQTSAATEEINSTVEHNAANAAQADIAAQGANRAAEQGGEAMARVEAIMGEINEAGTRIADIVNIIDSIAFQTNILALNAAVESARAGEAGRGFAVVASEVRALAQRSASAASDIKGLVEHSIATVNSGSAEVSQTGETMREVVESNARLVTLIGEISSSSQEQAIGLNEINQAMMAMDQSNHENNELAAQTDAIASELRTQANELLSMVATFNLPTGISQWSTAPSSSFNSSVNRAQTPKAQAVMHPVQPRQVTHQASSHDDWDEF